MKITATRDDGTEVDVTEGVQILYDNVIGSMKWGSGFLDNDEAQEVIKVANACGFLTPEEARNKLIEYVTGSTPFRCLTCNKDARWFGTRAYNHQTREFVDGLAAGFYHNPPYQNIPEPHPVAVFSDDVFGVTR